jgi:hypothetical protein
MAKLNWGMRACGTFRRGSGLFLCGATLQLRDIQIHRTCWILVFTGRIQFPC